MTEIVGIQFKNASRVYYFAPIGIQFKLGEYAIVETVRGVELGRVIIPNREVPDDEIAYELKPVIRKANDQDLVVDEKHQEMAKRSFEVFKEEVSKLNLSMKPLYCEYTIDSTKIIFYYSAEDRVDFRELLKRLTPKFRLRVELRQIGPREAARVIGGIGNCGRQLCCNSFLSNFDFVTMKMAKDQNMSLNTSKISGLCGKLMCCIAYEHELYQAAKKEIPSIGELVKTPKCPCCKVVNVDFIKKIVSVQEQADGMPSKYDAKDVSRVTISNPNVDITISKETANEEIIETKKDEELLEQKTQSKKIPEVRQQTKKPLDKKVQKFKKNIKKNNENK